MQLTGLKGNGEVAVKNLEKCGWRGIGQGEGGYTGEIVVEGQSCAMSISVAVHSKKMAANQWNRAIPKPKSEWASVTENTQLKGVKLYHVLKDCGDIVVCRFNNDKGGGGRTNDGQDLNDHDHSMIATSDIEIIAPEAAKEEG